MLDEHDPDYQDPDMKRDDYYESELYELTEEEALALFDRC